MLNQVQAVELSILLTSKATDSELASAAWGAWNELCSASKDLYLKNQYLEEFGLYSVKCYYQHKAELSIVLKHAMGLSCSFWNKYIYTHLVLGAQNFRVTRIWMLAIRGWISTHWEAEVKYSRNIRLQNQKETVFKHINTVEPSMNKTFYQS